MPPGGGKYRLLAASGAELLHNDTGTVQLQPFGVFVGMQK